MATATTPAPVRSPWLAARWFVPALLLYLAATFCSLHFFNRKYDLRHNDLAGRQFVTREALLTGADPYSPQMRHRIQDVAGHDPAQGFDYPVLLAVLLVPVASLPWETLRIAFLLVLTPALFASFWLWVSFTYPLSTPAGKIAITLLCLCSWPVIFALRLQQPTLLVALLVFPAWWLLSRQHDLPAGILLALSTFKPQLVLPLLLWLLLWAISRRRWTLMATFAVTEILFFLASQLLVPGWLPLWIADLHRYRSIAANLPLQLILGRPLGIAATCALAAWSSWYLWRVRRCPPPSADFAQAFALLLALGVCVTPVTWAMVYNQVLLIPASLLFLSSAPHSKSGPPALVYRAAQALLVWSFASVALSALCGMVAWSEAWLIFPFLNHLLAPMLALALLSAPLRQQILLDSSVGRSVFA